MNVSDRQINGTDCVVPASAAEGSAGEDLLNRRDLVIALVLGGATVAWWATFIGAGFELSDEGHVNMAGVRILRGQRPFADFFLLYFPGYAFWLAGAFATLGETILSARLAWAVFAVARTAATYLVARRLAGRGPAAVAALVAMALPGPTWKVLVAALFLFGLLATLRYGERPEPGRAALAGAVAGFAAWFRWDAALATVIAAGVLRMLIQKSDDGPAANRLWREAAAFAAGVALFVLPGLLWILLTPGAVEGVLDHFRYHRGSVAAFALPWPSPLPGTSNPPADLAEALRRTLYMLPLVGLVALPLQRFAGRATRPAALAVWLVALAAYLLAVRRPDPSHFVQSLPVALLPLLALRARGWGRWILAGFAALGFCGLVSELSVDMGARRPNPTLAFRQLVPVDLERARGIRAGRGEAWEIEAVVNAVQRRTGPEDPVAVLPAAAMILFLADRPPALRYDALYPVLLDDPERAAQASRDLARAKLVVLGGVAHGFAGPGSPGLPDYAPDLWRTLQENFRSTGRIGRFTLLEPSRE